jgi:hypothetical protein
LLNQRTWGSFGWYTVRFPEPLAWALTALVVAAVATALTSRRDAAGATRAQRAVLLAPVGALGAFVAARAWSLHVTTGGFPFIQGRYLFAGVGGLAVLVAIGVVRWSARWSALGVLVAALAIQVEAVRRCLEVWWGGPGLGPRGQLRAMTAWSGWPGEVVGLIGLGALGAMSALVVLVVLEARASEGGPVGSVPR